MRKLKVRSTPTILIVGPDSKEIDWHTGYNPPPTRLFRDLEKTIRGVDTVLSLTEDYARDPNNVETVFKLARKYQGRFTNEAYSLFRAVLELDPGGKKGSFDYQGEKVKYTEYAEYILRVREFTQSRTNPEPLKEFVKKYPESPLSGSAYRVLAIRFPEYWQMAVAGSPNDPTMMWIFLSQAARDKSQRDKAIELAEDRWSRDPSGMDPTIKRYLAELYMLEGESEMAELLLGESFIDDETSSLVRTLWSTADFWAKWKKHPERVEAAAEAILRIAPENVGARYQAARLYVTIGKEEKSLEIFGPAFAERNWDSPHDLRQYARFWASRAKNLEHALAAAKRAVELDSSEAENWDGLAFALWKTKDYDAAMKAEEKAVQLSVSSQQLMYKRQLDLIKKEKDRKK